MEPVKGQQYPLVLGSTLTGAMGDAEEYCSLRYDFLPKSVANAGQGQLDVLADSQVILQLPSSSGGGPMQFSGRQEPSRDGLDCVAIFDGTCFRLEVLHKSVKGLRPSTARNRQGLTPPPVSLPAAMAAAPAGAAGAQGMELDGASPPAVAATQRGAAAAAGAGHAPGATAGGDVDVEMGEGEIDVDDGDDDGLEQALMDHLSEEMGEGEEEEPGPSQVQQQPQQPQQQPVQQRQQPEQQRQQRAQQPAASPAKPAPAPAAAGLGAAGVAPSGTAAVLAPHPSPPVAARQHREQPVQSREPTGAAPASAAGSIPVAAPDAPAAAVPAVPAAPAAPLLPHVDTMNELDLEFFGDMVGSPVPPANSDTSGSSSDDDSSSNGSGSDEEVEGGRPGVQGPGGGGGGGDSEEFI